MGSCRCRGRRGGGGSDSDPTCRGRRGGFVEVSPVGSRGNAVVEGSGGEEAGRPEVELERGRRPTMGGAVASAAGSTQKQPRRGKLQSFWGSTAPKNAARPDLGPESLQRLSKSRVLPSSS